jgi:hypothetical protein
MAVGDGFVGHERSSLVGHSDFAEGGKEALDDLVVVVVAEPPWRRTKGERWRRCERWWWRVWKGGLRGLWGIPHGI